MNEKSLISIIVPVYNVFKYLEKCLESLLNQTYKNIEIIIVDDGSTDKSGALCDNYSMKDKRVRVYHKENGGLSSARNLGLEKSKGEYIAFVDSDDWVEENYIEKLLDNLKENNTNIAICNIAYCFDDKKINRKTKRKENVMDFSKAFINLCLSEDFDMCVYNKLYKSFLFKDIRFPEGKNSEDFYIMYKLLEKAERISFFSIALYNYFQRENSISRNKKINVDFLYAAQEQHNYIKNTYSHLTPYALYAVCSAYLTVFDYYLKFNVVCPDEYSKETKKFLKENIQITTKYAPGFKKRFQFKLFLFSKTLYTFIFKIYRKIRSVQ